MYCMMKAIIEEDMKLSHAKYEGSPDASPDATPKLSTLQATNVMHAGMQRNRHNVNPIRVMTTSKENKKPSRRKPARYDIPKTLPNAIPGSNTYFVAEYINGENIIAAIANTAIAVAVITIMDVVTGSFCMAPMCVTPNIALMAHSIIESDTPISNSFIFKTFRPVALMFSSFSMATTLDVMRMSRMNAADNITSIASPWSDAANRLLPALKNPVNAKSPQTIEYIRIHSHVVRNIFVKLLLYMLSAAVIHA